MHIGGGGHTARFIESLGDACLLVSVDGHILAANPPAHALYGRPDGTLAGALLADLCPECEHDTVIAEIASCNGKPRSFRAVQIDETGTSFVGEFSAKACHDLAEGSVLLLVRKAAEVEGALESDLTLRTLMLNHITDGIVCHTLGGDLLFANKSALGIWGLDSLAAARALGPFGWVNDSQREGVHRLVERMIADGGAQFESHGTGPTGTTLHLEIRSTVIEQDGQQLVVSSVRDISERMETEEMMRYLAYHDMLTGLANRVLLETELAHAVSLSDRHGDHVGVVFLDLNDFKPVNDTYGHAIGDHVLREVADRIAGAVRETDTVARPGGDEFVVVLPRLAGPEALNSIAAKLASEIARPITIGNVAVQVNASVGIALHEPGESAEALLTRADLSMYRSREHGIPGWELDG